MNTYKYNGLSSTQIASAHTAHERRSENKTDEMKRKKCVYDTQHTLYTQHDNDDDDDEGKKVHPRYSA